jgi:hypothetical protein
MSPHFGLMDETTMSREGAMLMRAKLHWRCGVRRLRENNASSAALATLYDALLSGMRWYILRNLRHALGENGDEKLENERFVFFILRRAGILDQSLDVSFIEEIVDKALMEKDVRVDHDRFLDQLDQFLTRLGILPFDESELPPELPSTL